MALKVIEKHPLKIRGMLPQVGGCQCDMWIGTHSMDTVARATWIPKNDALETWVSLQIEHGRARFADGMISRLFVEKGFGNELKTPKVMKFILIVPYITHRLWTKIHLLVLFLEIQHEDIWVFPKIVGKPPKWMVKIMENPIKIDDLGRTPHYFRKPPYEEDFSWLPCWSVIEVMCFLCLLEMIQGVFPPLFLVLRRFSVSVWDTRFGIWFSSHSIIHCEW